MTITLSLQQTFSLAEQFTKVIHCENTTSRLHSTWGLCAGDAGRPNPYQRGVVFSEIKEVRAAIASITDPRERRNFITTLKWHFDRLMAERNTPRKWQDYYASVAAVQAEQRERRAA